MRFFFDHCISHRLAAAIGVLRQPQVVQHLRDRYRKADTESVPDTVWIEELSREGGWVIISGDLRIKKRPQERLIWKAAKLTTFFMADGFPQQPEWEQVKWLIDKWPLIEKQADLVAPGSAFLVPKRGSKLESIPV